MQIHLITVPGGLTDYTAELLRAWGLRSLHFGPAASLADLDPHQNPVTIAPAGAALDPAAADLYTSRGGTLICFLPELALARWAGLTPVEPLDLPRRFRMTAFLPPGFAGETPPIVGAAAAYRIDGAAPPLAYLSPAEGAAGDLPALTLRLCPGGRGQGRVLCFAFDLPRCVLLLRQGDPARADFIAPGDACHRPSHFACTTPWHDAGWLPYADLLGRLLVELVARHFPAPLPLIDHLPDAAPALLLYSGDEDMAAVSANDDELDYMAARGARMDLYVIPGETNSTPDDVRRYAQHHDVNPHPNLRPLDGQPVERRAAELERQIRLFETTYARKALTLRTHCTAWCGYMEHVEALERCGIHMDSSYLSGSYLRRRDPVPYNPFGAALPLRFCRPDGRLLGVLQQHLHVGDDSLAAPDEGHYVQSTYSYRYQAEAYAPIAERLIRDVAHRLHTPLAACIHPSNWATYSRAHGEALVHQAARFSVPIWSFTQWSEFWLARDKWSIAVLSWGEGVLRLSVEGPEGAPGLRLALPGTHAHATLREVTVGGHPAEVQRVTRYGRPVGMLGLPGRAPTEVVAHYH